MHHEPSCRKWLFGEWTLEYLDIDSGKDIIFTVLSFGEL